uniref:Reverse transcriptase domain-containing protein n=1 Tax=Lactuca sativa TaxID=4236 RepID=A0A9R1VQX3_LACSA|nr:hypothetical protein LSAT_V11C400166480 [Lactuca sativa]
MVFIVGDQQVSLKGNPSLEKSLVSFKAMERTIRKEKTGVLIELNSTEMEDEAAQMPILFQFQGIFDEPTGLPQKWHIDHQIVLKEGTDPVSVRPYRYPHFEKEEVEKMIQVMLMEGVIQPSGSPYSSLVILVKKKMGLGIFVLIIGLSTGLLFPTSSPFPLLMRSLMNCTGQSFLVSSTFNRGITKSG